MPSFAPFDQRKYQTVPAREGYARWAATYEETIKHEMDLWLLRELQSVKWDTVKRCADLGCGTGRTGAWLASKGVTVIDGVDATPDMLDHARDRHVFTSRVWPMFPQLACPQPRTTSSRHASWTNISANSHLFTPKRRELPGTARPMSLSASIRFSSWRQACLRTSKQTMAAQWQLRHTCTYSPIM